jgi:hypothetical protein
VKLYVKLMRYQFWYSMISRGTFRQTFKSLTKTMTLCKIMYTFWRIQSEFYLKKKTFISRMQHLNYLQDLATCIINEISEILLMFFSIDAEIWNRSDFELFGSTALPPQNIVLTKPFQNWIEFSKTCAKYLHQWDYYRTS